MIYNNIQTQINRRLYIPESGAWPESWHRFDKRSVHAIIAALAANKSLLVRGEPGVGKSQLACAAAAALGRRFIAQVIQPNTEYQELLWTFDHTQRLADAQLAGAMKDARTIQEANHYISPGALWWAYSWEKADNMTSKQAFQPVDYKDAPDAETNGVVLLIDEIDKADIALANGLLEVLGNGRFAVPPLGKTITQTIPPLVVLTSNDTRQLPPALIRRCVVLDLALPALAELPAHLLEIGKTHFPNVDETVLSTAAKQIVMDREQCRELPKTGQAEYIDLLKALTEIAPDNTEQQLQWLEQLAPFFLKSAVDR